MSCISIQRPTFTVCQTGYISKLLEKLDQLVECLTEYNFNCCDVFGFVDNGKFYYNEYCSSRECVINPENGLLESDDDKEREDKITLHRGDENSDYMLLCDILEDHNKNINKGSIIFRNMNIDGAFSVQRMVEDCNYCSIGSITDLTVIREKESKGKKNGITIVILDFDSENG